MIEHDAPGEAPLDPIPQEIVGTFKAKEMVRALIPLGFVCLLAGLGFLSPDDKHLELAWNDIAGTVLTDYRCQLQKRHRNRWRRVVATKGCYREHFDALMKSGILVRAAHAPRFCSTYFAVPKLAPCAEHPLGTSRAIFNGHRLSELGNVPPAVNLPGVTEFVPEVTRFLHEEEKVYVSGGDLRHWFHQLRMPSIWHPYFGLSMEGSMYTWTTLPMGWSHSPYIAQCAAWSFLAARLPSQQPLFDESVLQCENSGPPRVLRLHEGLRGKGIRGFAMVYYDNYLIVVNDSSVHQEIMKRVAENARRFRVAIKPWSEFTVEGGDCTFEFLGVRFNRSDGVVTGRPEKLPKWVIKYAEKNETMTLHEAATWAGRMLFSDMMSPTKQPRMTTRLILRELGRLGSSRNWRTGPLSCPEVETALREGWAHYAELAEQPYVYQRPRARRDKEIVVATDASLVGHGIVWFDEDGRVDRVESGR